MNISKNVWIALLILLMATCGHDQEQVKPPKIQVTPPFAGTIFLDPDIITASDKTTFVSISLASASVRAFASRVAHSCLSTAALDSTSNVFAISPRANSDDFGHIAYIHAFVCNAAGQKRI